jgi:hypothetical protein
MVIIPVSCNKNSSKETADVDADSQKSFCETLDVEIFENGNGECPSIIKAGMIFKQIVFYSDYDSTLLRQESGLTVTIKEASLAENINSEKYLKIKAIGSEQENSTEEHVWSISFSGYDSSIFDPDALIGRKWRLFLVDGFYGSIHADGISREFIVIKEDSGRLIAVSAKRVVNEDHENDWDVKIWPSKLVPDITSEVLHPENCVPFQCREIKDGMYDDIYRDVLVAPPVKFNRNGKSVIVKNGEEKKLDGYIYTISDNMKIHEKDPDKMIFDTGKKYQYNFQILNTEALK